jgi:hypothetical protein
MSVEEDKTHFSMWCMMNSPMLAGNDLRTMSSQTLEILTNKEIIALNKDIAFVQARRVIREGELEVWVKPLGKKGKQKAVAILNRGGEEKLYSLIPGKIGISTKSRLRDLWEHKNLGRIGNVQAFTVPKHGIIVLRID